jgi:tRNA (Thr-GGU) A37 N-methylase
MTLEFNLDPVGVVRSTRVEAEDDQWDSESSSIEMLPPFGDRALQGLTDFSHCIVVYVFDKASWDESRIARHPRGNKDWPEVGIFAQRAKNRRNTSR